jgi:hypothetical protein
MNFGIVSMEGCKSEEKEDKSINECDLNETHFGIVSIEVDETIS